jgi:hypothetical protein
MSADIFIRNILHLRTWDNIEMNLIVMTMRMSSEFIRITTESIYSTVLGSRYEASFFLKGMEFIEQRKNS